jgi:lycopene cyclase domain-containing protein
MSPHYTYFSILAAALAGPLALSFDKKVAFYKKWKYAFPAMPLPALLYIIWDSWFTRTGVWAFNETYITGIRFFDLPVEEILFFFVVPYCCLFIYECIRCYFPRLQSSKGTERSLMIAAVLFCITGLLFYDRDYTASTFFLCGIFTGALFVFRKFFRAFHSTAFLVSYAIILVPFLIVNGFLTAIPVVSYNDAENLGVRIGTIPVEDIFYGLLLVMMNIVLYGKLKHRGKAYI